MVVSYRLSKNVSLFRLWADLPFDIIVLNLETKLQVIKISFNVSAFNLYNSQPTYTSVILSLSVLILSLHQRLSSITLVPQHLADQLLNYIFSISFNLNTYLQVIKECLSVTAFDQFFLWPIYPSVILFNSLNFDTKLHIIREYPKILTFGRF